MHLEFFGAAGEVTGSCHILDVGNAKLLLDCALIPGGARPHERNRSEFPFDAARDAMRARGVWVKVSRPGLRLDLALDPMEPA